MLTQATGAYYALIQNLSLTVLRVARGLWATDPATAAASLLPVLTGAQAVAAHQGIATNKANLTEQAAVAPPEWVTFWQAIPGWSNNGQPLDVVLGYPNLLRGRLLAGGYAPDLAGRRGLASLERLVTANIADAGTDAGTVDAAARPLVGFVRVVGADACDACVLLAGRFYHVAGFERHPHCLCVHQLAAWSNKDEAQAWAISQQRAVFDAMSQEQQDKRFGKAQAEAIRAGADIGQVVNERRGRKRIAGGTRAGAWEYNGTSFEYNPVGVTKVTYRAQGVTREGMAKGYAAYARGGLRRQTIPALMGQAGGDRDVLRGLLKDHGYIVERDTHGNLVYPTYNLSPHYVPPAAGAPVESPLLKALAEVAGKTRPKTV
jgi:hypothetical protein